LAPAARAAVPARANGSAPAPVNGALPFQANGAAAAHGAAPIQANGTGPVNGTPPVQADGSGPDPGAGAVPGPAAPLRVSARHLKLALDELLDTRHDLTRVLLGGRPMRGADVIIRPVLPHLRPSR
ncbi:MAG: hypothetical protein JWL68_2123, partial [Actinomycetia bacterium]|nr:hypothetical protein [Actinomycetes bacterium]